jgi:hypothetical protein
MGSSSCETPEVPNEEPKITPIILSEDDQHPEETQYVMKDTNPKEPLPCILLLIVDNVAYRSKQMRIQWNQELRTQVNFRMPANNSIIKVAPNKQKVILAFQKLRLREEWGNIEDSFSVEMYDKEKIKEDRDEKRRIHK